METITNNTIELLVPKKKTLCLIGDLDGSMSNFLIHLRSLKLTKRWNLINQLLGKLPTWIGWSMRLILSGDILADRSTDGFSILQLVNHLRSQAELLWGGIDILAWNHEEKMIWFLVGNYGDTITLASQWTNWDHRGITELSEFWSDRSSILDKMRTTDKWRMILSEIWRMNLILIQWDTIHSHTPMSKWMLDSILALYHQSGNSIASTIDHLNSSWRQLLTRLLWEKNLQPDEYYRLLAEYRYLANIFLHPLNGTRESIIRRWWHPGHRIDKIVPDKHPAYDAFLNSWIHTIYHGHTDDKIAVAGLQVVSVNRRTARIEQVIHSPIDDIRDTIRDRSGTIVNGK